MPRACFLICLPLCLPLLSVGCWMEATDREQSSGAPHEAAAALATKRGAEYPQPLSHSAPRHPQGTLGLAAPGKALYQLRTEVSFSVGAVGYSSVAYDKLWRQQTKMAGIAGVVGVSYEAFSTCSLGQKHLLATWHWACGGARLAELLHLPVPGPTLLDWAVGHAKVTQSLSATSNPSLFQLVPLPSAQTRRTLELWEESKQAQAPDLAACPGTSGTQQTGATWPQILEASLPPWGRCLISWRSSL